LQRLAPGKMRIGFFIGAGCPLAIRVPDGDKSRPLIDDLAGLTRAVKHILDQSPVHKDTGALLWERVIARGISVPTVEDILSHLRTLKSLCETGSIDGFSSESLLVLDAAICKEIRSLDRQHDLHLLASRWHPDPVAAPPEHRTVARALNTGRVNKSVQCRQRASTPVRPMPAFESIADLA
jgi:hypothetical protein